MKSSLLSLVVAWSALLAPAARAGTLDVAALERIFGAGERSVGEPIHHTPPPRGPLSEDHALVGTFAASASPGLSLAILVRRQGASEQRLLALGDELEPGVRLTAIHPGFVVARRDGAEPERIDLDLDAAPSPRPPPAARPGATYPGIVGDGGDGVRISPAARDRELARLPELLRSVRSSPVRRADGGLAGFRLHGVKPGSLIAALGIEEGDVVTGVDGRPLDDLAVAAELLSGVRTREQLEIEVERDGRRRSLRYEIASADAGT